MTKHDRRIEWSEKTCGVLLLLYPAPFRERFGQEILSVFRECCEEQLYGRQRVSLFNVWLQTLKDLAFSILRERAEGLLGSRQNRELLFRASMDSIALLGICLYVALWGQAMALCAVGRPQTVGEFMAVSVLFTISLGGVCILRSLIVARVRPHSYLCLGLKGRDLGA